MKTNRLFFIAVLMTCLFQACSTDVDMLAEPKEITAIYGILDYKQDTNFVKINNKETLAQVFTDIRYTRKDNEAMSKELVKTLKKQGFLD